MIRRKERRIGLPVFALCFAIVLPGTVADLSADMDQDGKPEEWQADINKLKAAKQLTTGHEIENNLLLNAGFEQIESHRPVGWRLEQGSWGDNKADYAGQMDTDIFHNGATGMKVICPDKGHHQTVMLENAIPIKANTKYGAGGWSKSDGGAYTYFIVFFYDRDGKELSYKWGGDVKGSHDWTMSSFIFTAPPNAQTLVFRAGVKYGAVAWFDDLFLREVGAEDVDNLVFNSSFEVAANPGVPDCWNREGYNRQKGFYARKYWGLDSSTAYHGRKSLRLAAPLTTFSIGNRGISVPFTLSVYMKSSVPGTKCKFGVVGAARRTVSVGTSWTRYALVVREGHGTDRIFFKLPGSKEETTPVWVDAVQLETGENTNTFSTSWRDEIIKQKDKAGKRMVQVNFREGKEELYAVKGLKVDGKPFLPFWVWGLSVVDAAELKKVGVNTVFGGDPDEAQSLGLKAFVETPDPWSCVEKNVPTNEFFAAVRRTVEKHKDHPALLGYFTCDEPRPRKKLTAQFMKQVHAVVKNIDPQHPTYINQAISHTSSFRKEEAIKNHYIDYVPASDIVGLDVYPVPTQPIDMVAEQTDIVRKYAEGKVISMVLQFFGGAGWWWREPTPWEFSAMTYLTLIHGARSVGLFFGRPTYDGLWEEMKKVAGEVEKLAPVLFSSEISGLSEQIPDGYACGIHALPRRCKGKLYLITVNAEYRDIEAEFSLPGSTPGGKINVLFENRDLENKNGSFSDLFRPYQRHVYGIGG